MRAKQESTILCEFSRRERDVSRPTAYASKGEAGGQRFVRYPPGVAHSAAGSTGMPKYDFAASPNAELLNPRCLPHP